MQIAANRNAPSGAPSASAMSSTSGGIGKTDDSANASTNSAAGPHGCVPHESTQAYSRRRGPGRGGAASGTGG